MCGGSETLFSKKRYGTCVFIETLVQELLRFLCKNEWFQCVPALLLSRDSSRGLSRARRAWTGSSFRRVASARASSTSSTTATRPFRATVTVKSKFLQRCIALRRLQQSRRPRRLGGNVLIVWRCSLFSGSGSDYLDLDNGSISSSFYLGKYGAESVMKVLHSQDLDFSQGA